MNAYRLQRLFHPVSHRTLIVAIDHALFNNAAFLEGIEQMQKIVGKVAQANADGVLLSVGEAHHLQRLPGRRKTGADVARRSGQFLQRHRADWTPPVSRF